MVTVRSAKNKGNSFEYDCAYSLTKVIPDIVTTQKTGFVQGYDLISHSRRLVIECKFHKRLSWNEAVKYWNNLVSCHEEYAALLIFKTNQQPVLVFDGTSMVAFKQYFGVEFEKRPKGYTNSLKVNQNGKKESC